MRIIKAGATSQSVYIEVLDSTSTTGGRKTGLVYNTAGLTAYYARNAGSATAITLATLAAANSAYSSGGFKEVDATNMPGVYRLDLPDAAIAAGAPSVVVTVRGATGMVQVSVEIQLTTIDLQDAVRGGMTALPNANAEAAGGLYTRGTGAGQINQPANGQIDANTVKISGTTQTARDLGASVLISSGTGTGQLDVSSGVIKSNLAQILGTALTETAGQIAAAFKQFFDVAGPTGTMKEVTSVVTVTNLTNAPTSGDLTATMKASVTTAATAATPTAAAVTAGVTVSTNNDKTGYGLSAAGIQSIWDALTSALTTVGSIGKRLADYVTGDAYARLGAPAGASVSADVAAIKTETASIKAKTDLIPASPAATGDIPTAAANADAVWDEALAGHLGAGSTGNALNAAGSAGDPWATAIPGAYGAGTAGKIVGDNLNATVGSRSSHSAADVWASAARTLTAATNITSTGGTTVPQTGDSYARLGAPAGASLAADVAAVKVDTAATLADTGTDGVVVAAGSKTGYALTAAYDPAKTASQAGDAMALTAGERTTLTAAIWAYVVEGTSTAVQYMRLMAAALFAKLSGAATTTVTVRDVGDTKARITATVDADGNRSAVTLDAS